MKPRLCHASENTAYAADMTIMLAYQKAIDDINDDRSAKARLLKGMLEKPYAAVCEKYPDKADIIEARLNELYAIEQRNRPGEDTDAASGCFGALLVAVIVYALLVIVLKAITYDDCMLLPKGDKIAKILRIR